MRNYFYNRKDYDDLRKDITEVRIDYKSWMRTIKVITFSVTIILAVLAYFGYDKIDSLENTIIERTNNRLAQTDSILSKIDEKKINEINQRISDKEKEYTQTLKNFEKIITQNRRIEDNILALLPSNKRIERNFSSYYGGRVDDFFDFRPIENSYKQNSIVNFYLIFKETFDLNKADVISLNLFNNNYIVKQYYYLIEQRFNKIDLTFDVEKGDYTIEFGFLSKSGDKPTFHCYKKAIKII
jgi:hypothetical protein